MRTCSSLLLVAAVAGCTTTRTVSRTDGNGNVTTETTTSTGMTFGASDPVARAAELSAEAERVRRLGEEGRDEAERQCRRVREHVTSLDEERAIGRMLARTRLGSTGPPLVEGSGAAADGPKARLAARVDLVGRTIARCSARPDLPWTFGLVERPEVEASSEPGGSVLVTTGLLKTMKYEAELAGVLAHVSAQHKLLRYREARWKQCVAATSAAYHVSHGAMGTPMQSAMMNHLKYDDREPPELDEGMQKSIFELVMRTMSMGEPSDLELETDRAAADTLTLAGYDVAAYEQWLSAHEQPLHPPPADRVAKLRAYRESRRPRRGAPAAAKPRLGALLGD